VNDREGRGPGSDSLDELLAAPLTEFATARSALAARLGAQGRTAEAAAVHRLRKPTAVVWAINKLARADPAAVTTFLDGVKRLRSAQLTRRQDVAAAAQSHRATLQALMKRAPTFLSAAGITASPTVVRRLSATLLGAAANPELAEQLRHGRLTAEQQAPGFEVFGGQMPAGPTPAAPTMPRRRPEASTTTRPDKSRQEERAQEARRAREIREAARAAAREQAARRKEAQQFARTATQRRRAATEAARALEQARARIRALEDRATASERAAVEAERAAANARAEVDPG
jgi:hypothetical protein